MNQVPVPDAGSAVATSGSANVIAVGGLALLSHFGISSWAEAAGFLACVLALTQLAVLWWKVMWRPLLIRLGWLKRSRRTGDASP